MFVTRKNRVFFAKGRGKNCRSDTKPIPLDRASFKYEKCGLFKTKCFILIFLLILRSKLPQRLVWRSFEEFKKWERHETNSIGSGIEKRRNWCPAQNKRIFFEFLIDFKARRPHLKPELTFSLTFRVRSVVETRDRVRWIRREKTSQKKLNLHQIFKKSLQP